MKKWIKCNSSENNFSVGRNVCTKCRYQQSKNRKGFEERRDVRRKKWRIKDNTHPWNVYILPHEHYCGISSALSERLSQHRTERLGKKNTDDWYIVAGTETKSEALQIEASYHKLGYKGDNP